MGQSLVKNYIHIIFSTKNRVSLINSTYEKELHKYLGGICNNLGCPPIIIGGYNDHVHILTLLSKQIPLMKLLEELKANSSKWMKTKDESLSNFYWQVGYGAFSVNPAQLNLVIEYIENQHEHHKTVTFQEEFRGFLERYKVEFDERYLWD